MTHYITKLAQFSLPQDTTLPSWRVLDIWEGVVLVDPWVFAEDGLLGTGGKVSCFHLGSTEAVYVGLALRKSDDVFQRIGLILLDRANVDPLINRIEYLGDPIVVTIY